MGIHFSYLSVLGASSNPTGWPRAVQANVLDDNNQGVAGATVVIRAASGPTQTLTGDGNGAYYAANGYKSACDDSASCHPGDNNAKDPQEFFFTAVKDGQTTSGQFNTPGWVGGNWYGAYSSV